MITLAVSGPGWVRGGLSPTGPAALVPSPSQTPYGPGLWNGTAAPSTHTQGHLVTTMLKLRGGERKEEKDFPVFAAGDPPDTGWGRLALKESSMGAGGYRKGTSTEIMYRGGGCPHSAPNRAELAHGGGMHVRGTAPVGVSPPDPLLRVPWGARGWE